MCFDSPTASAAVTIRCETLVFYHAGIYREDLPIVPMKILSGTSFRCVFRIALYMERTLSLCRLWSALALFQRTHRKGWQECPQCSLCLDLQYLRGCLWSGSGQLALKRTVPQVNHFEPALSWASGSPVVPWVEQDSKSKSSSLFLHCDMGTRVLIWCLLNLLFQRYYSYG